MSLRYLLWELAGLFEEENDRDMSEESLLYFLETLCDWNVRWLKKHPNAPRLYDEARAGRIVYKVPEQMEDGTQVGNTIFRKGEHFRDIPAIMENGGGDCDNLACWRVAELRVDGYKDIHPYITNRERPEGGRTYHCIVWWPTPKPKGSTEDPSLICGMGGPGYAAEREEELRKNTERAQEKVGRIKRGIALGIISPAAVKAAMAKRAKGKL